MSARNVCNNNNNKVKYEEGFGERCEHLVVWSLTISLSDCMNECFAGRRERKRERGRDRDRERERGKEEKNILHIYGYRGQRSLSFIDYEAVRTVMYYLGAETMKFACWHPIVHTYIPYAIPYIYIFVVSFHL